VAGKKIKPKEEAISEILFADTDSESGAEAHPQIGRPSAVAKDVLPLESCYNKHWPVKSSTQLCCVLLTAKERAQCMSAPDMTWACAWCLVPWNITRKQICKSSSL